MRYLVKVVDGFDIVDKIKGVKTTFRAGHQDVPTEDVIIKSATLTDLPDLEEINVDD